MFSSDMFEIEYLEIKVVGEVNYTRNWYLMRHLKEKWVSYMQWGNPLGYKTSQFTSK